MKIIEIIENHRKSWKSLKIIEIIENSRKLSKSKKMEIMEVFSVVCLTAPAERRVHPPGAPRTNEGLWVGGGYLIPGLGRFNVACLTALVERLVHSPGPLRTYEETGAHMCGKTPGHSGRSGTHRHRRLRHWLEETREILTTSGASRLRSRGKIKENR